MSKKGGVIGRVVGEIGEIAKDVVKEGGKELLGEGLKENIDIALGRESKNVDEGKKEKDVLKKLTKKDDKERGPQIAEQKRIIAEMHEREQQMMQRRQQEQQAKIIDLEEERRKRSQQGIKGFVEARGKRRESIFPHKQKATTDIPESVERIKRKIA